MGMDSELAGSRLLSGDREAIVNYVGPMEGKPYVDVNDFTRNRLSLEAHKVTVGDARSASATSLDVEGFVLMRHRLPSIDFRDHEAIVRHYLPAMQDVVTDVTGADLVLMSDGPITRFSSASEVGAVRPAGFAHTDYTARSARDLLAISYDRRLDAECGHAEAKRLLRESIDCPSHTMPEYRRCVAVQTWRPLSNPPHDFPLALCAANSVSGDDIVEADFAARFSDFDEDALEFSLYRHSPRHSWWHYPDMEPDEVLIFVGYDFGDNARSRVLHSAFRDDRCPPDAPGRSSVEARSFVFYR